MNYGVLHKETWLDRRNDIQYRRISTSGQLILEWVIRSG
jgi:hypothetical protein